MYTAVTVFKNNISSSYSVLMFIITAFEAFWIFDSCPLPRQGLTSLYPTKNKEWVLYLGLGIMSYSSSYQQESVSQLRSLPLTHQRELVVRSYGLVPGGSHSLSVFGCWLIYVSLSWCAGLKWGQKTGPVPSVMAHQFLIFNTRLCLLTLCSYKRPLKFIRERGNEVLYA